MFDVASSSAAITSAYADIGVLILVVVTAVLAAWAGLVGLGFAIRKATAKVTGRKF